MVLCMSASIAARWSDISPLFLSNCVSTSLTDANFLLIGSSKELISFLYAANASLINV